MACAVPLSRLGQAAATHRACASHDGLPQLPEQSVAARMPSTPARIKPVPVARALRSLGEHPVGGAPRIGLHSCDKMLRAAPTRCRKQRNHVVSASSAPLVLPASAPAGGSEGQTLESWVTEAAFEIVSHLQEAPFLHLVFDSKWREAARRPVSEDLFAEPGRWSQLKASVLQDRPDGMILVHRLQDRSMAPVDAHFSEGEVAESEEGAAHGASRSSDGGSAHATPGGGGGGGGPTDWWGVVVAGRSIRRHSCYLLKTTRVGSTGGACTRFSLTRARCFGPALHQQMEDSWLA